MLVHSSIQPFHTECDWKYLKCCFYLLWNITRMLVVKHRHFIILTWFSWYISSQKAKHWRMQFSLSKAHASKGAIYHISDRYGHLPSCKKKRKKEEAKIFTYQASIGSDAVLKCWLQMRWVSERLDIIFLGSFQFSSLIESSRLMTTPCF